jgi:hypothetical protein
MNTTPTLHYLPNRILLAERFGMERNVNNKSVYSYLLN